MRRVVVTGIGCVNSIANNTEEFYENLKSGTCGIKDISLFETDGYRTKLAAQLSDEQYNVLLSQVEEKQELRVLNFALKACDEAVKKSNISGISKERFGVSIASSLGCIDGIDNFLTKTSEGQEVSDKCYFDTCARVCDIISKKYDLCGPVFTTSTACAAGTNSIGIAFDSIRYGHTDAMICGGVDPLSRISINGFNALKSLSAQGLVRAFSQERDGLIIGEGAGIVVLEEYEHAIERNASIYGEVVGYAISNDAYHMTTPDPNGGGAIRSIESCIKDAGLDKEMVDYINAHGTGTVYNDRMEIKAIRDVFGEAAEHLCISSNKGMIGHMLGAAGSIEFIATILSLLHQFVPPTINYESCIEGGEHYEFAPNKWIPRKIEYALSNSFAFAGNGASIMLKRYTNK